MQSKSSEQIPSVLSGQEAAACSVDQLAARERRAGPTGDLLGLESDGPSPAKLAAVENAISQAAFSIERIDKKWPGQRGNRNSPSNTG